MIKKFVTDKEPVIVAYIITAIINLGATYGLSFDGQAVAWLTVGVGTVVGFLARSVVTSKATLEDSKSID